MVTTTNSFENNYGLILDEIQHAMELIDPAQVEDLVKMLLAADKVFVIGVGRVMLSLKAFAKRLNHIGIRTFCVGDINEPAITERDILLVGSGSGESVVPLSIARIARRHNATIAHIGSNPNSSLAPLTDVFVRIPVKTKLDLTDEIQSQQIMSSLFEQCLYILGDTAALMIVRLQELDVASLWQYHANLE